MLKLPVFAFYPWEKNFVAMLWHTKSAKIRLYTVVVLFVFTILPFSGRYFAASVYTVAVNVINKKMLTSGDGSASFMYYLNDGIYGTFNFLAFNDHYSVTPLLLKVMLDINFITWAHLRMDYWKAPSAHVWLGTECNHWNANNTV